MAAMLQAQATEMDMSNVTMPADQAMAMDMADCEQHQSHEPTPQHSGDCHKCYFCLMGVIGWLMPEIPHISIAQTHTLNSSQTVLLSQTTNSPPYHPPKTLST